jgi:hypothetical protein
MSRGGRRMLVLPLLLGLHALLAYVLLRETATRKSRPPASQSLVVEAISASLLERAQPFPADSPLHEALRPAPIRDAKTLQIAPLEFESQPITPATPDWSSEASAAAAAVIERARNAGAKHFGPVSDPTGASGEPGAFGSEEQNHRAGRVEGGSRFWVTDNCYYDFPRGLPPPARMAGEFHLMTPTCKPPPTGGGGKMFEALKPENLRTPPPAPGH